MQITFAKDDQGPKRITLNEFAWPFILFYTMNKQLKMNDIPISFFGV